MSGNDLRQRLAAGSRLLVLSALGLTAIGVGGHFLGWTMLTTTLGPTAYVLIAHPHSQASRLRNSALGHGVAAASALFALAALGLWSHPSVVELGYTTLPQVGAEAIAVGLTLFLLAVLRAHHAPAAATALLIASGIAAPGPPLFGLLIGLAGLLILGPLLTKVPLGREEAAAEQGEQARPRAGSDGR